MHRYILLALAAMMAIAGPVAAQENKQVRSLHGSLSARVGQPGYFSAALTWFGPLNRAERAWRQGNDGWTNDERLIEYRVKWSVLVEGKSDCQFSSYKKANRPRRGNAFVPARRLYPVVVGGRFLYTTGGSDSFTISSVKLKTGDALCVQVRPRYQGENPGPWVELRIAHPGG